MRISVIIPAHNEERYLPATLHSIDRSRSLLPKYVCAEVLVVDNASTDGTAAIARSLGARVVREQTRNIACVRNTGARATCGDVLVFIDADTQVPESTVHRIAETMADPRCGGGALDTDYRPARAWVKLYLLGWRLVGLLFGMAQGAGQFCRRDLFERLGGYDERMFMGEDVDFYWRLRRAARRSGMYAFILPGIRVFPSCRRYDQWSAGKTLVWTNPIYAWRFARRQGAWPGWYEDPPR